MGTFINVFLTEIPIVLFENLRKKIFLCFMLVSGFLFFKSPRQKKPIFHLIFLQKIQVILIAESIKCSGVTGRTVPAMLKATKSLQDGSSDETMIAER